MGDAGLEELRLHPLHLRRRRRASGDDDGQLAARLGHRGVVGVAQGWGVEAGVAQCHLGAVTHATAAG